jgi:hypothetical protein
MRVVTSHSYGPLAVASLSFISRRATVVSSFHRATDYGATRSHPPLFQLFSLAVPPSLILAFITNLALVDT